MEITDKNIKSVLTGIDNVSERASNVFNSINKQALKDANVTDLSASDVANRVAPKVIQSKPKNTESKKPTPGL